MNDIEQVWARLVRTARQSETTDETEIPSGFATRVIANWKTNPQKRSSVWEFLSVRALACAFLLMAGSIATNYNLINNNWINNLTMNYNSVYEDWINSSKITDIIPELIFTS